MNEATEIGNKDTVLLRHDGRCRFYLKSKDRECNAKVEEGTSYCGNHSRPDTAQEKARNLGPSIKAASRQKAKQDKVEVPAYCLEDCNAGSGLPADLVSQLLPVAQNGISPPNLTSACDVSKAKSRNNAARIQYALKLQPAGFADLLQRITVASAEISATSDAVRDESIRADLQPDSVRPFSLRHAMQQASIVGNMGKAGLLEGAERKVYVEYGAGKGYLSSMLSDLSPAQDFLLVDNQSFRHKAERSLRKTSTVERIRMDIKDFYACGHKKLQQTEWVATGKHICGAGTDFCLRSCVQASQPPGLKQVKGLAIAPCCHHRCSWKHYTGKDYFKQFGFSPAEFELISWMSGWALCGHESPAGTTDEGTDAPLAVDLASCKNQQDSNLQGCQEQTRNKQEFHGQNASSEDVRGASKRRSKKQREASARTRAEQLRESQLQGMGESNSAVLELDQQTIKATDDVAMHCNGQLQTIPDEQAICGEPRADPLAQSPATSSPGKPWFPGSDLRKVDKMKIGLMCKKLIDAGRVRYLEAESWKVELVVYIAASISGENKLILAQPSY